VAFRAAPGCHCLRRGLRPRSSSATGVARFRSPAWVASPVRVSLTSLLLDTRRSLESLSLHLADESFVIRQVSSFLSSEPPVTY
jgi:hypothetical protein